MHKNIRFTSLTLFLTLAILSFCGCTTTEKKHDAPHWGYSGHTGPAHWGELSPDFILAKTGKQQSPIDIRNAQSARGILQIDYNPTTLEIVNNGHAIQLNYKKGSFLKMDGATYELKQFHIHSPSEHTVNGEYFDMEIHLVHISDAGKIAVAGVLFKQGKKNVFLEKFWKMLPETPGERILDKTLNLNAADVLPANKTYYAYDGSLTTPPCSEGVKWYVLSEPAEISAEQLAEFQKLYKGNFRPVQPLNGRIINHCR